MASHSESSMLNYKSTNPSNYRFNKSQKSINHVTYVNAYYNDINSNQQEPKTVIYSLK